VNLDDLQRVARMLAASGYFDAKGDVNTQIAQIATKIMAGAELGYGPFASVSGIHVISGRPSVSANLMASAVKNSSRYDYRVREISAEKCTLEFFEFVDGKRESLGESTFTREDAGKAKTQNMDKFPRNMLFARAMSNGIRWFCADVFAGNAVFVPEEMGADTDEDGNVVDVTPPPAPANDHAHAPQILAGIPLRPETAAALAASMANIPEPMAQEDNPFAEDDDPAAAALRAIVGTWRGPMDAQMWAVQVGACENDFEAKASFRKIVESVSPDNKLTKGNQAAIYAAFFGRQQEKLAEKAAVTP